MNQEEHNNQVTLFSWAALEERNEPDLKWLFSTLNGVRLTIGQAVKAKKAGNKKGVLDIWLPIKRGQYCGLVIELKVKGRKPKPEQKEWIDMLIKQGRFACVCNGYEEAKTVIENYLKGE